MILATILKNDQDALIYKNHIFLLHVCGCYGLTNQMAVSR